MALSLQIPPVSDEFRPRILVCGVGGAGGNAVNNMIRAGLDGVEFLVANTDAQDLAQSLCEARLQLGPNTTRGLGAGAQPDVGAQAAEESAEQFAQSVQGANMAFIAAGMGGGTGTGAAPVLARVLREQGILTVGVVTKPFNFEGQARTRLAEQGIKQLQDEVDTLIVIPNQNLFRIANDTTTFADAFRMADNVLLDGVRGVSDLIVKPGIVNLDFADVRSLMTVMGKAMMGTGTAEGDNRALEAAERAIANPLLDDMSLDGARGVLINVTGSGDLTLFEVDAVASHVREKVDPDANIIFGSAIDETLDNALRVSVLATGIDAHAPTQPPRPEPTPPSPSGPGGGQPRGQAPARGPQPRPSQPPVFLRPPFGGRNQDPRGQGESQAPEAHAGGISSEAVRPMPAPQPAAPAAVAQSAQAHAKLDQPAPLPPIAQRSEAGRQAWESMTQGPIRPMQASGQPDPAYRHVETPRAPFVPAAGLAQETPGAPVMSEPGADLFDMAYDDQAVAEQDYADQAYAEQAYEHEAYAEPAYVEQAPTSLPAPHLRLVGQGQPPHPQVHPESIQPELRTPYQAGVPTLDPEWSPQVSPAAPHPGAFPQVPQQASAPTAPVAPPHQPVRAVPSAHQAPVTAALGGFGAAAAPRPEAAPASGAGVGAALGNLGSFVRSRFSGAQAAEAAPTHGAQAVAHAPQPQPQQAHSDFPMSAGGGTYSDGVHPQDFGQHGQPPQGFAPVPERAQPRMRSMHDNSGFDLDSFDEQLNAVPDFLRRTNS